MAYEFWSTGEGLLGSAVRKRKWFTSSYLFLNNMKCCSKIKLTHINRSSYSAGVMKWWKEGNVLFNDALNTFYLRLYGVRNMVKNHSDSKRGNPMLPLHGLLFPLAYKLKWLLLFRRQITNLATSPALCSNGYIFWQMGW